MKCEYILPNNADESMLVEHITQEQAINLAMWAQQHFDHIVVNVDKNNWHSFMAYNMPEVLPTVTLPDKDGVWKDDWPAGTIIYNSDNVMGDTENGR